MVKGIGPKTAKLIVAKYGTRTFEILDNYPDSLLEIKGITRKKLDKILMAYNDSHAVRDLAAYLTPFKVTPKKIRKIYEHFGNEALDVVKTQPFTLCEINGFGFLTVDEIAGRIIADQMNRFGSKAASVTAWNLKCRTVISMPISRNSRSRYMNS